jgi:hypothetical protein
VKAVSSIFVLNREVGRLRGKARGATIAARSRFRGCSMKRVLPLAAIAAAAVQACTASVYHPTKSAAEMQGDVDLCTRESNRRYWMDPIAALYNAYDCLEAKGYSRSRRDFAARVERALGEGRPAAQKAAEEQRRLPCQVPCKRD